MQYNILRKMLLTARCSLLNSPTLLPSPPGRIVLHIRHAMEWPPILATARNGPFYGGDGIEALRLHSKQENGGRT